MAVAARGRCGKVAFSVAAAGLEVVAVLAPRTGSLTTAALVAVSALNWAVSAPGYALTVTSSLACHQACYPTHAIRQNPAGACFRS